MDEHIDRAIKESCPFLKENCIIAQMRGCSVVEEWVDSHKARMRQFQLPFKKPPVLLPIGEELDWLYTMSGH